MKTILIIGAGFSGVMTAVNLLRTSTDVITKVLLLNRTGKMARGLAYGTQSPKHTLNVPCGNMSAFPDEPSNFLRFAQRINSEYTSGSFVPRSIYGDYLEFLLEEAEQLAGPNVTLDRLVGEAVKLKLDSRQGGGVTLTDGRYYKWDKLVLAFGHFPSGDPLVADSTFYNSVRYIRDPWNVKEFSRIATDAPVMVLGTGLTAIDACMTLLKQNATRPVFAISRRGLLPQHHRYAAHKPILSHDSASLIGEKNTVRAQVRAFRKNIGKLKAEGGDWRDALAALRPHTASIWRAMPDAERRRFLRHVQPYWDSHRHRLAPAINDQFRDALDSGTIRTCAGRVLAFDESAKDINVSFRQRGSSAITSIQVGYVVNCTGPSSALLRVESPLVRQLLDEGRIVPDKLGLGLHVKADGAVIGSDGQASTSIYYVGPLLKADYWEATAVPELRQYAQNLAKALI